MDWMNGLIEGALAGIGKILPLSAPGHRLIIEEFFSLGENEWTALFGELGALLALLFLCRKSLSEMGKGIKEALDKARAGKYRAKKAPRALLLLFRLLIACIPPAAAVVIGFFYDFDAAIGSSLSWAGIGFLLNAGLIFIGAHSKCNHWEGEELSGGLAFKLGLFRAIGGILPGLSPFGATAAMGMNMGFEPIFAAEFSLLLAIPSLLGSILIRMIGIGGDFSMIGAATAAGCAAGIAALSVVLIRAAVKKERFGLFAIYSALAGIAAFILKGI